MPRFDRSGGFGTLGPSLKTPLNRSTFADLTVEPLTLRLAPLVAFQWSRGFLVAIGRELGSRQSKPRYCSTGRGPEFGCGSGLGSRKEHGLYGFPQSDRARGLIRVFGSGWPSASLARDLTGGRRRPGKAWQTWRRSCGGVGVKIGKRISALPVRPWAGMGLPSPSHWGKVKCPVV